VAKFLGLLWIAGVVALTVGAWRSPSRRTRTTAGVLAILFWCTATVAFLGLLAVEAGDSGSGMFGCAAPSGQSAEPPPSRWSWLPPGEVCEYASGDVDPTYWRIPAAVALLACPLIAAAFWPRRPAESTARPTGDSP
jgi:hypothetical protein